MKRPQWWPEGLVGGAFASEMMSARLHEVSDRILVIAQGRLAGELTGAEAT